MTEKEFFKKYPDADPNRYSGYRVQSLLRQPRMDKISHELQRMRIRNMVRRRNHTNV